MHAGATVIPAVQLPEPGLAGTKDSDSSLGDCGEYGQERRQYYSADCSPHKFHLPNLPDLPQR